MCAYECVLRTNVTCFRLLSTTTVSLSLSLSLSRMRSMSYASVAGGPAAQVVAALHLHTPCKSVSGSICPEITETDEQIYSRVE